ncbi:MAG: glycosyltransferase family 4 protein [Alphaproteobacteria bacterium]
MAEGVAFYAPLKPPDHPVPSGDRRMARALMTAMEQTGRKVDLASRLRSFDRTGDRVRQQRMKRLGERVADRLIEHYRTLPGDRRPKAWVTYHAYHKSPDWLGPQVRRALDIPYLLIETSFAPKQAGGPWDLGHRATEAAVRGADLTLAMTGVDEAGLAPLVEPPGALRRLPPFLDPTPYRRAARERDSHRADLAMRFGLDVDRPWLLAVAMMRDDVKRESYALLAQALRQIQDRDWQILIVGDGPSRPSIENLFAMLEPSRAIYAGILDQDQLPACYAAADVYAWPAIREAYGMALLEAQASGLPVVAGREGGVTDVVQDGVTGMLTQPRDPNALAVAIADLLGHAAKRTAMSAAAQSFVDREHSLDHAAAMLDRALIDASAILKARAHAQRALR